MFTDIAEFEARKFYAVYHKELETIEAEMRQKEKIVDGIMAMATSFFLTTWALVALRAYGIF